MQPRSQGLFPILSAGREKPSTKDREKALGMRLADEDLLSNVTNFVKIFVFLRLLGGE